MLVQTMAERFNKGTMVQRDIIIRNVFLNLHFDGIKIANYSLAEPFATLLKSEEISRGWGEGTRTPAAGTKTRCPTTRRLPNNRGIIMEFWG